MAGCDFTALGEGQGLGCGAVLGSWVTQAFR